MNPSKFPNIAIERRFAVCAAVLFVVLAYAPAQAQEGEHFDFASAALMLYPHGFEPAAITLPAGPVRLKVYNRIGRRDLDLVLEREEDEQGPKITLRSDRVDRGSRKWSDEMRVLTPGVYLLREASNEEWECRVTVVPAGQYARVGTGR